MACGEQEEVQHRPAVGDGQQRGGYLVLYGVWRTWRIAEVASGHERHWALHGPEGGQAGQRHRGLHVRVYFRSLNMCITMQQFV